MTRPRIPDEVLAAAHARSRARTTEDWAEADRLRAEIEAAGWTVVDRGTDFALRPSAPPDVETEGRVRYGASRNVPSRLDEPATGAATVVMVVAGDDQVGVERAIAALRATSPEGVSIVIVADDPSTTSAGMLDALETAGGTDLEIVWTSARLGPAAAFDIALRRASAPVVIRLDPRLDVTGDIVTPLVAALEDPSVAITGGWGSRTADVRAFAPVPVGEADVIDGLAQAFRRADYVTHGPVEPRLGTDRFVAVWWSLAVRDAVDDDQAPRRALRVDLPATPPADATSPEDDVDARLLHRDYYRVIGRFGGRTDLLGGPA